MAVDLNKVLETTNTNTENSKAKGPSYSLYAEDLHVAHINFDDFVNDEEAKLFADLISAQTGLQTRLNDGSTKEIKREKLNQILSNINTNQNNA
jgi:hypothetical protein